MVGKKKKNNKNEIVKKKKKVTVYRILSRYRHCGVAKVIGVERLLKRNDIGGKRISVSKVSGRCVYRLFCRVDNETGRKITFDFYDFFFIKKILTFPDFSGVIDC